MAQSKSRGSGSESEERSGFDQAVQRTADAAAELLADTAAAVAGGVREGRAELNEDNAFRLGYRNGVVKAVVTGGLYVLEETPKIWRRTYDILADESSES